MRKCMGLGIVEYNAEWGYEKVYGVGYSDELSSMKEKLVSLFNEYKHESDSLKKASDEAKCNEGLKEGADATSDFLMMDFDDFSTKVTSHALKLELNTYLEEQLVPRTTKLNVIGYWKTNDVRYPTLARMARDILAVPISTVASESAFSTGGRVLDPYRSSLKPSTVEAIICFEIGFLEKQKWNLIWRSFVGLL